MDVQALGDVLLAQKEVDVHKVKQRALNYIKRHGTRCSNEDMLVIIPVVYASIPNAIDTKVVLALLKRIIKLGRMHTTKIRKKNWKD